MEATDLEVHVYTAPDGSQYSLMLPRAGSEYYAYVRQSGAFGDVPQLLWHLLKPGDVLIDVGSNVGAVSIPVAAKGVSVFSIDALPQNVAILQAATRQNALSNIAVYNHAVWSKPKRLRIAGVEAWGHVSAEGSIEVEAVRLDDFVAAHGVRRIDAIKIDIEGAELAALAGMRRLLGEVGPDLVVEANAHTCGGYGYSIHDIFRTIERYGYTLFRIAGSNLVPFKSGGFQETICCDYFATKRPDALPERVQPWEVHSLPPEPLIALMKEQAGSGPCHKRYMAHVSQYMPEEFRADPELAVLIEQWRQESLSEAAVRAIEAGSRPTPVSALSGFWRKVRSLLGSRVGLPRGQATR